jgi:hypothetical protein
MYPVGATPPGQLQDRVGPTHVLPHADRGPDAGALRAATVPVPITATGAHPLQVRTALDFMAAREVETTPSRTPAGTWAQCMITPRFIDARPKQSASKL